VFFYVFLSVLLQVIVRPLIILRPPMMKRTAVMCERNSAYTVARVAIYVKSIVLIKVFAITRPGRALVSTDIMEILVEYKIHKQFTFKIL
jgi:hypothetical protein